MTTLKRAVGTTTLLLSGADLNSMANNTGVLSSVNGTSGQFVNVAGSGFDGYTHCKLSLLLKAGAAAWTAGGCLKLWFVHYVNSQYEYYSTSAGLPREPDAVFYPAAIASDQYLMGMDGDKPPGERTPVIDMPAGTWKLFVMNVGLGQALAAASNTVYLQPITDTDV
jgi:hypothetical protein